MAAWLFVAGVAIVGVALLSPSSTSRWNDSLPSTVTLDGRASQEVGAALIAGAVVGTALLFAERALNAAQVQRDRESSRTAARENLRLTLSLSPSLTGIDLGNSDLSGFYLRQKNLIAANLDEADLSGANLIDANLGDARLKGTCLARAYMFRTNLSGAMWDDKTIWPNEEFRRWALANSEQRLIVDRSYRFSMDRPSLMPPLGIACPQDDERYDPSVTASQLPPAETRQAGYL